MQIMNNGARSAEVVNYQGSGAAKLRRDLAYKVAQAVMRKMKREETKMTLYDELVARGLIAQVTDEALIKDLINNGKATFYIGFDPTADSLHVGHFMALCLMKRLQMAGNKPIALIGGGTAMIGDPSGRTDMRKMLTPEQIQHNVDCFKKQMARFIDFSDDKALLVNNADWLLNLNYVELLREVGACFSVNNMLRAECYKQRMEKGLSFLEFNYMIMQSYDFYMLYQKYGCNLQFGGNDQWSNMLGGTELIRRKLDKDASAMTITLLLNSEGKKMGKTASGAVWLDPDKTSPYDFYQYWRNVDDADVLKCIINISPVLVEMLMMQMVLNASVCSHSFRLKRLTRWIAGKVLSLTRLRRFLLMSLQSLFMVRKKLRKQKLQQRQSLLVGMQLTCLQQSLKQTALQMMKLMQLILCLEQDWQQLSQRPEELSSRVVFL